MLDWRGMGLRYSPRMYIRVPKDPCMRILQSWEPWKKTDFADSVRILSVLMRWGLKASQQWWHFTETRRTHFRESFVEM